MCRDISANSSVQGGGCRSVPVHWNCCCCPCGGQWTACSSLAAGDASLVLCRDILYTTWPWLGVLSPVALERTGLLRYDLKRDSGSSFTSTDERRQRWLYGLWRAGHPPRAPHRCRARAPSSVPLGCIDGRCFPSLRQHDPVVLAWIFLGICSAFHTPWHAPNHAPYLRETKMCSSEFFFIQMWLNILVSLK